MKNRYYLCCLFVSSLFFSSCNHYMYTPPEANLLMLSEEKDMKVSAGVGFSALNEGNHNVQFGYSPKEHLGVALNYFQVGGFTDPADLKGDNRDNRVSSTTGEVAIGYYSKKNIKSIKEEATVFEEEVNNQLIFDGYAGYGRTNLRRSFQVGDLNFNSQQYFLQGGVHFQSKSLGLSYTMRGVLLDYLSGNVNGKLSDTDLASVDELNANPFTFIESSFRIRVGKEKFKFYFSRNWMMAPFNDKQLEYTPSSWHVGVVLDLNEVFGKE